MNEIERADGPRFVPTEEQYEMIERMAFACLDKDLALALGVTLAQFKGLLKHDEKAARLVYQSRAKRTTQVAEKLHDKALEGDVTAQRFYLQMRAGWREKIEVEHQAAESLSDALSQAAAIRKQSESLGGPSETGPIIEHDDEKDYVSPRLSVGGTIGKDNLEGLTDLEADLLSRVHAGNKKRQKHHDQGKPVGRLKLKPPPEN